MKGHVLVSILCMLILIPLVTGNCEAAEITLHGAGASFPFPVYSKWAHTYQKLTGVTLNYQSIGSSGGIAQITAKTVDFGASDAPLNAAELERLELIQFPMIMGGVVPIVNLKGLQGGELQLSSTVLADIFLGKISTWNDSLITELNKTIKLPDQEITIVHRADGSGTTNIFTHYLSTVSSEWKNTIGVGKSVDWPVGVGGKGNEGVAAYVQKINGAIGYVEYAYALLNNQTPVLLKNQAGKFVAPTIETFQAAAANADWEHAPGFYLFLTDQPGENSWPITGVSYILIAKEQQDEVLAKTMLTFFDWCYQHGTEIAKELHYVPMPENVVQMVESVWQNEVTIDRKPAWMAK